MKTLLKVFILAVILVIPGCSSEFEGWKSAGPATGTGDVKALMASADALYNTADTAEKVKAVIDAYEKILTIEPANFEALTRLGEFTFLYAYIYNTDAKVKDEYYIKSIQYCERAMYTNPEFRKLVDKGTPVSDAVSALGEREFIPIFYRYCAHGNRWNDCLGTFSKLTHYKGIGRNRKLLERMTALNPEGMGGNVHMLWGAYHSIVPGYFGGDIKKSAGYFDKAIKVDPDFLDHYYVRARYLHIAEKNREAFRKDLNHVLAADISKKTAFPYVWSAAYKVKARELLAMENKYF